MGWFFGTQGNFIQLESGGGGGASVGRDFFFCSAVVTTVYSCSTYLRKFSDHGGNERNKSRLREKKRKTNQFQ